MKRTVGAMIVVGCVLAAPFAVALIVVASDEELAREANAAAGDEYEYDYPTSLWANH